MSSDPHDLENMLIGNEENEEEDDEKEHVNTE